MDMNIAKVVQIVASSNKSFEDAVNEGLTAAARTIRGITGVKVIDWTAKVENNRISQYRVTMDIAFHVEEG
jgi:flavin-binding protein dodecin